MKYLVVGAGGTGGIISLSLAQAGKDVTLIARGEHLKAIKEKGLCVHRRYCYTASTVQVKAMDAGHYRKVPDVIFLCVKEYSLDKLIPFLSRVAGPDTLVIPILNGFGNGRRLQDKLPGVTVLDGCIYVAAEKIGPGELAKNGAIMRLVYGLLEADETKMAALKEIEKDLRESGFEPVLSDNIQRDCMKKFSYVSPVSTAGLFYDAKSADFQKNGAPREMLKALMGEIAAIASAMGCALDADIIQKNLNILDRLSPKTETSLQRDIAAGNPSEIKGQVYDVIDLAAKYDVSVPTYTMVAEMLKRKYPA